MQLKFKRFSPDAKTPAHQSAGAACFDIHALQDATICAFGGHAVIGTGLAFEVPEGHALMIYSRSGHGFNNGVRLVNCTGVIDSDYRGEIRVGLRNDSASPFTVKKGDRIAQAMIIPVPVVVLEEVEELTTTERGTGGFGSTGR